MRIVLTSEAVERFEDQVRYLREIGSLGAADRLSQRILIFLDHHLSQYPRTGRWLADVGLWETWVPGTRLVLWYRVGAEELTIVTVWHAAQDRARGVPQDPE